MPTTYEIRLYSPVGTPLAAISRFTSLECALVENSICALKVVMPPIIPLDWLQVDAEVELWRSVDGGAARMVGSGSDGTVWFVKKAGFTSANGVESISFTAYDAKIILASRHIDSAAGSPRADKTGALDNIMRQVVRENLGSVADVGLDINRALGAGFWNILTIEADTSYAPSASKSFAHREVLPILQDLAAQSATLGTYLSFDVIYQGRNVYGYPALLFQVFKDVRGVDRGATSAKRLVFSRQYGTISDSSIEYDWTDEANSIKAGGAGDGAARLFEYAQDNSRVTKSPFGRVEDFIDRTNVSTSATLVAEANAELWNRRPRLRVAGTLVESPNARFGIHFNHGDIVTFEEANVTTSARLSSVRLAVSESGEQIDMKVSTETII